MISLSIVADDEPAASSDAAGGACGAEAPMPSAAAGSPDGVSAAGEGGARASGELQCAGAGSELDDDLPRGSVEHAIIVLGEIHWLPCDGNADEVIVPGPFVVDLLGNVVPQRTLPKIPDVPEPPSGFCGLEAPLAPATAPAELAGRSLFFDGTRSDGTRFVLYADVEAKLRVERHGLVVWNASDTPAVLWALRPRRWLSRMAIDQETPTEPDGTSAVVIDLNRHPLLLAALRRRLAGKSSLFRDLNGNQHLDAEDRGALVGDGSDDPD